MLALWYGFETCEKERIEFEKSKQHRGQHLYVHEKQRMTLSSCLIAQQVLCLEDVIVFRYYSSEHPQTLGCPMHLPGTIIFQNVNPGTLKVNLSVAQWLPCDR